LHFIKSALQAGRLQFSDDTLNNKGELELYAEINGEISKYLKLLLLSFSVIEESMKSKHENLGMPLSSKRLMAYVYPLYSIRCKGTFSTDYEKNSDQ
jgi:hypothetical protein